MPPKPPVLDQAVPWLVVANTKSGHNDPAQTRATVEAALSADGRGCEYLAAEPQQLARVAVEAAGRARAQNAALIGVGGDGTINTVAQAAHQAGCAMGFVPQGTFNYFGRMHRIPLDAQEAMALLLQSVPQPVQVGYANDQLFLVNASVGLYPEMFEDREAWKRRFGRHRLVAILSSIGTILSKHRRLKLRIELDDRMRDVSTPTLFIGNNRLQLERVGLPQPAEAVEHHRLAAVMARETSTRSLLWLLLRGAMGTLGDMETVESFSFQRMRVEQRRRLRQKGQKRQIKLAYDGEVRLVDQPIEFRVAEHPLYLIKPTDDMAAPPVA
ncbi:MAG: diacylglycerol kinase family protein [Burkholderiaceae bacterium]